MQNIFMLNELQEISSQLQGFELSCLVVSQYTWFACWKVFFIFLVLWLCLSFCFSLDSKTLKTPVIGQKKSLTIKKLNI